MSSDFQHCIKHPNQQNRQTSQEDKAKPKKNLQTQADTGPRRVLRCGGGFEKYFRQVNKFIQLCNCYFMALKRIKWNKTLQKKNLHSSIFASRWRYHAMKLVSYEAKKGVGKAMGQERLQQQLAKMQQAAAQSSVVVIVVSSSIYSTVYTTSVGGKSTTRGKKEGQQSYTNSYKRERGFFSIIISQAWPPKEVTRLATTTVVLYTTGSFPSPLLYGPSTLQTNGKARYV